MLNLTDTNKVIIIGGGTAGWISSLFLKDLFPRADILLIEAPNIPTIGVGEGTYRNFRYILDKFNIDEQDFLKKTSASLKLGIGYKGWRNDGADYIHFFHDHMMTRLSRLKANGLEVAWPMLGYEGNHIPENSPYHNLIKCKASLDEALQYVRENDVEVRYGYHFNSDKVASYLRDVALQRGIHHILGKVANITKSSNGYVESVELDDGQLLASDLIIDCSGMRRVAASQLDDYEFYPIDHLKVDSAVGFFVPHEVTGFSLLTEAIAMKHGWMWIIPTQERSGCGYVFSSAHCTLEMAQEEIQQYFNAKIDFPLNITFKSGYNRFPLNKNVMTAGLATGFLEPLEATSIAQCISQLNDFSNVVKQSGYILRNKQIELINKRTNEAFSETAKFIHLHYLGGRADTPFWVDMHKAAESTASIEDLKQSLTERLPREIDSATSWSRSQLYFTEFSYFSIFRSLGLISDEVILKEVSSLDTLLLNKFVNKIQHICQNKRLEE